MRGSGLCHAVRPATLLPGIWASPPLTFWIASFDIAWERSSVLGLSA
jgi:hypothetical protein